MPQLIDLSSRLTNERPKIQIDAEHIYEVHNSKNTAILLDEISKNEKIANFAKKDDKSEKVIEAALGEEALEYIRSRNFSPTGWNLIVEAIMAAINEVELEEIEKEAKKAQGAKVKEFRK